MRTTDEEVLVKPRPNRRFLLIVALVAILIGGATLWTVIIASRPGGFHNILRALDDERRYWDGRRRSWDQQRRAREQARRALEQATLQAGVLPLTNASSQVAAPQKP